MILPKRHRELYYRICLRPKLADWLDKRYQTKDGALLRLLHWRPTFSNVCRYCKKPLTKETICTTQSYWWPGTLPCHKDCRQEGRKQEARDCQEIDKDCNYCKDFERDGNGIKSGIGYGDCTKFNKPVTCYPQDFTGNECFTPR